jgi:hypothetical protein
VSGPIERVVVRLDAASENRTAIDTAARLAARAKAPLHGVFVEDEDLLRLGRLPFARQITLGAGAEAFTTEQVELHLRVAAERARRDVVAAAKRHAVKCSFEIVRGDSESALSGATARDLVVAGALTRPIAGYFRVESRWLGSVEAAPGPFLLAQHNWSASGSLVILLRDRSAGSVRLIEAAAQIAEAEGLGLTVICSPSVAGATGLEKWISERLAAFSVRLQIEVSPPEPAALRRRIVELDCRLLAIEAGTAEGDAVRLREFAEHFVCDVLIVH